ncbi:MAG: hypothetical protein JXX28_04695 [Deltaproteobacteria bacterium]|nr:hypothetical protein [Deltaproteobacteria bacterium]
MLLALASLLACGLPADPHLCPDGAPQRLIAVSPLSALPGPSAIPTGLELGPWTFPSWDTEGLAVEGCPLPSEVPVTVRWPGGAKAEGLWGARGPEGAWTATWPDGATAASLYYQGGALTGEARFYKEDGALLAEGTYSEGAADGRWAAHPRGGLTRARFVRGIRHGGWEQRTADGQGVRGHYFNGTKNYEWDFTEQIDGSEVTVLHRAWKLDTFVAEWDPRAQPNPLSGRQLPGHIGPQGEGLMKVHATCATNAIMTLSLTGHALDLASMRATPALSDWASDATQTEAPPLLLVRDYHIDAVELTGEHRAVAHLTLDVACAAGDLGALVAPAQERQALTLPLRWQDEVWKLEAPLPLRAVRPEVYLAAASGVPAGWELCQRAH